MATVNEAPRAPAPEPKTRAAEVEKRHGPEVARRAPAPPPAWEGRPAELLRRASEEMDRAFDRLFEDVGLRWPRLAGRLGLLPREEESAPAAWMPRVDVLERGKDLVIRADLPGLTGDDVRVEVTDDMLTIRGERKEEEEREHEGYYYSERRRGTFYRAIPLPEGVDTSKAAATFRDGVLEVAMPAPPRPERQPRRLEVRGPK